ncbi:exocyst complex component 3 [Zophobas morio]|uniref:exocyst complex component 3 n=1 Tax=Zophobas morio TaxID=2755281 RepID=UPI003082FF64
MADCKSTMRELEATAKTSATTHVINMFQRPGQLEKVDQFKRRLTRKKNSVEALLKSAMQQQLDGVRTGLNQLHCCLEDVREIDSSLKKMFGLFSEVPQLCNQLNQVRDENMRHSQYVTARENLKHIFTVPESVEKTKQWINEGKLLHTHQCLRDLENSRDDLLYELHKLPNQSPHDKSMLKAYFADVETLSNILEKQLRLILSRTLNTVRKEPTVIVTALRIIEREEKTDQETVKQGKLTGFLPPGRPKKWKEMAFEVLEKSVATRVEGTQVDEREDNKHWLIRYLELTRQLILEDLRVVKTLCVPCFPPRYNIIDKYIQMYHNSLSRHLQEVIQNGLQGNEYVTVLSWVNKTYHGFELLGHPDLFEHTKNLGPLLPQAVMEHLESDYLKNIEANYIEWMRNTLTSEEQEWRSDVEPTSDNYSRTAAPIIIFQMIDQNLQVSNTISTEMTCKVLIVSIEQIINYGESYGKAVFDFKTKYFEDRKQVPYFTQYMIIIINNCLQLNELGTQLEKQYWTSSSPPLLGENFSKLRATFIQLRNDAGDYLLEELCMDLDKHFDELFNTRWLGTTLPVDTICATLDDYFLDYNRLSEPNYKFIVHQARALVSKRYLTALLSKRVSFKTYEESVQAAAKIVKEAKQLGKLLDTLCSLEGDDPFETVILLTEVLKSDDDMLSFELHRIVEKYPDIMEDHLLRLLSLRGDLARSDIRDKVAHLPKVKMTHQSSVFRTLVFPKLVNLNVFNN